MATKLFLWSKFSILVFFWRVVFWKSHEPSDLRQFIDSLRRLVRHHSSDAYTPQSNKQTCWEHTLALTSQNRQPYEISDPIDARTTDSHEIAGQEIWESLFLSATALFSDYDGVSTIQIGCFYFTKSCFGMLIRYFCILVFLSSKIIGFDLNSWWARHSLEKDLKVISALVRDLQK